MGKGLIIILIIILMIMMMIIAVPLMIKRKFRIHYTILEGYVYYLSQNYPVTMKVLTESLRYEKELLYRQESVEIIDTFHLIGFVYLSSSSLYYTSATNTTNTTDNNNKLLLDTAMVIFKKALLISINHYGSIHEKVAVSLLNVGMVIEKQGSKKDALRTFMAARDTYTKFGLSAGGNNSQNNNSSSRHGSNSPGMNTATRSINEIRNELLSSTRNDDNDKNDNNNSSSNSS